MSAPTPRPHRTIPTASAMAAGTATPRPRRGRPASKRIVVGYGFWIFLLSDIIMFSAFFAAYAVLARRPRADRPGAAVRLANVGDRDGLPAAVELRLRHGQHRGAARKHWLFHVAMAVTFVLGAVFLGLELKEFAGLVAQGAGPQRSAFLSAFFTLVGCHGLHVTAGLLWLLTMMAQVFAKGFRADILRRILCFSLFWHALDIIWVARLHRRLPAGSRAMSEPTRHSSSAEGASRHRPRRRAADGSGVAQASAAI